MNISGFPPLPFPPSLPISHAAEEPALGETPPAPVTEPTAPADQPAAEREDAKGVLRLLQAGHFKGVADVRLRINFHAELTAIQNQGAADAVERALPAVQSTVTTGTSALEETGELTEEQALAVEERETAFLGEIQTAVDEALSTGAIDTSALAETLRASFDQFEAALTEALSVAVETEVVEQIEGEARLETQEAPTALSETFQAIIASMREEFEAAVASLESTVADALALPELSEPSGNGRAYDKFLAIYQSLFDVPSAPPPAEGELVETQA